MAIANIVADPKLRERIYNDLFSPWLENAWKALWNIFYLATTVTLPLALLWRGSNIWLESSLRKFEEKLNKIPENERIEITPDIGVPILENLTHISDQKIADLFIKLLEKASKSETSLLVHPKYIKIIESLHTDEATLIVSFAKQTKIIGKDIPCFQIRKNAEGGYRVISEIFCGKEIQNNLKNESAFISYINNLESLWLLKVDFTTNLVDKKWYEQIKECSELENFVNNPEFKFQKGIISITTLWMDFIQIINN